jgi:hypothetical protein
MKRLVLAGAILLASGSTLSANEKEAGLGFEYGVSMQSFKDSHFKSGGANFFRLNLKVDDDITYFVHNESGSFSANDSDSTAVTTVTNNITGIGAKMTFDNDISASLMFGSATLNGNAYAGNAVPAIQQTAQVAEIGVNWEKTKGKVTLATGLVYRHLALPQAVAFGTENVTDLSSTNLNIAIKYSF